MIFKNVSIDSFAYFLPEETISSDQIEQMLASAYNRLSLPFGRLELMTGIKERRMWPIGTRSSLLAINAAKKLFQKSKIGPDQVDLLIHASVCRDFLEPATATVVHNELKIKMNSMAFDLSNACLGVMNALLIAGNLIESGVIKNALIVSGENSGPLLLNTINELKNNQSITRKSIKKYIANLTIGSAATAIMLTSTNNQKHMASLLGGVFNTDSNANHLCRGDGNSNELMMETDSEELLKFGINLGKSTFNDFLHEFQITQKNISLALMHQVGSAHESLSLEAFQLKDTPTFKTYPTLGNTGSSALPITLMLAQEENKIKSKDFVALLGIGSGLVSAMLGVKWN